MRANYEVGYRALPRAVDGINQVSNWGKSGQIRPVVDFIEGQKTRETRGFLGFSAVSPELQAQ